MKFIWKGRWREGEIIIEAETLKELETILNELASKGEIESSKEAYSLAIPEIVSVQGCASAIRVLLKTNWGQQPKTMNEIKKALEANALHFSKGTLSGTLTTMTRRGDLRRVKKGGKWKYFAK